MCLRFVLLMLACALAQAAPVERWGSTDIELAGPSTGNPFMEVDLSATFRQGTRSIKVPGFYDGDGKYKIRFMPDQLGAWTYETQSNRPELSGKAGKLDVIAPGAGNHGPVGVRNTRHFAYADGTPYWQVGTTSYAWTHQTEALQAQTLATLSKAPFNKMRMAVFPNHDDKNEPPRFPFAGSPPKAWDFTRFDPAFFRNLELRVGQLRDLGIEADLILFHPYDKGYWGFDRMPDDVNQRYLRYVVARLAAYRNVWWSMANEFDFLKEKTMPEWDSYFQTVQASDPYQHLRSIHNAFVFYNHTKPWVTHVSVQSGAIAEDFERAVLLRDVYNKPVVYDEVKYEGNFSRRWGQLKPEEMVLRFWQGAIAGTYVGHSETYEDPKGLVWLAKGGTLRGQSPDRLAFFRKILSESPAEGLEPIDKWQDYPFAGKHAQYYLGYFGKQTPTSWPFMLHKTGLKDGMKFKVEVIDTWNMTIEKVPGEFEIKQKGDYFYADTKDRSIALPGRPYMALRITRLRQMEPPPSLSDARINTDGATQKNAWLNYLTASRGQLAADQAALAAERVGIAPPAAVAAGGARDGGMPLNRPMNWYGSAEAIRVADNIVSFQTPAGGWSKNVDRTGPVRQRGQHYVAFEGPRESWNFVGTIDNSATMTELRFLARVQGQVPEQAAKVYRESFAKGVRYLLNAQYPNGGMPQVYPLQGGYHDAITLNDNALAEVLEMFQLVAGRKAEYGFVPESLAAEARAGADKIVELVLAMQVKVNGVKTGWGQQHDALKLAPVGARNFEPIALASAESARILTVLMQLPNPSPQVVEAVHAGAAWLERTALRDVDFKATDSATGRRLVAKPGAGPIWSRYYDIETMKPIFGDRDRSIHEDVNELSLERRNGYSWYNEGPLKALQRYAIWNKR
jgi:PelA/Pel-15E family pectate lyase